jgi:hypothetical protein
MALGHTGKMPVPRKATFFNGLLGAGGTVKDRPPARVGAVAASAAE